jgi:hypothetical protein
MSAFGMMLRESPYRGNLSWAQIRRDATRRYRLTTRS